MTDHPLTLSTALLIGFFSSMHCIGMCGSIMGALSLSLPSHIRDNRLKRLSFISMYNLGRILSYTLAGVAVGSISDGLLHTGYLAHGHTILRGLGVMMMVMIGLYLAGWFPQLSYFEKIGIPVWRHLEPIGRRMMPVNTPVRAFGYGIIWGWLPCGLVYTVLLWSLTSGSATNGALTMAAFGIGTLPTLITAGLMTSWLAHFSRSASARRVVGIIIILMAFATLFIPENADHTRHLY